MSEVPLDRMLVHLVECLCEDLSQRLKMRLLPFYGGVSKYRVHGEHREYLGSRSVCLGSRRVCLGSTGGVQEGYRVQGAACGVVCLGSRHVCLGSIGGI